MTVTRFASGTQLCVIGTEHNLATGTTAGNYHFLLDLSNLVAGDILEARVRMPILGGGSRQIAMEATYNGALTTGSWAALSPSIPIVDDSLFSIEQPAGTGRNVPWAVILENNEAQITEAQIDQIVNEVWDEDATGHQTQGTFGQVVGDSGADSDSIWSLANTNLDAAVSSRASQTSVDDIQTDTNDIQTRLPAALVGGKMDSDATAISGDTTAADNLEKEYDGTGYGLILVRTTIATLSSQTSFTLTAGSADNDAYNECVIVIEDASTAAQKAVGVVSDYVGASKTVTLLEDPAIFTIATTDIVTILAIRAGDVWDVVLASHQASGSTGEALDSASTGGDPWATALPGAYGAGTAGNIVGTNLDATVSSRSTQTSVDTIDNLVDDLETRLGTPSDFGSGATVAANLVDIEAQTDDIGAAGAGLSDIPWNADWDVEVQSEVNDALVALSLDKLVIVSGTADSGSTTTMVDAARTEADNDYWKGRLILFTSGNISGQCAIITDFVAGTDTFTFAPPLTQAVSTQTYVILPGISTWDDTLAEHLLSGSTGAALNAAGSAGDPWSTALPGAYGAGTAGNIVGTNLDTTVSSRASQTSLDTLDDFVDTEVAAIKAKTDQLTFTTANKVDATIQAAGDFAQAAADKVWSTASRTLTAFGFSVTVGTNSDKTGYSLSSAGIQAIWDALTSALTTAGSIGKLLVDNINATISSRSTQTSVDTVDDLVDDLETRLTAQRAANLDNLDATVSSRSTVTTAQVNAEVVDALATDTYAESASVPAATASLKDKIVWLATLGRNKITQTSTTQTLRNDADSADIATASVSDDGTTATRDKWT